jgi:hypothetical protein
MTQRNKQEACDGRTYVKNKDVHLVGILKKCLKYKKAKEWRTLK